MGTNRVRRGFSGMSEDEIDRAFEELEFRTDSHQRIDSRHGPKLQPVELNSNRAGDEQLTE